MSNEIVPFLARPTTMTECLKFAELISKSSFCPPQMRGKPGDVLLSLQMGSEVRLSYMQSLQNIAVINSKPCLYGDGTLAVCMSSPHYEFHEEWFTGEIEAGDRTAHCKVKRKGSPEHIRSFSMDDAKKAGLWGKAGPWTLYPDRMLQMRARAFAVRDKFADALKGISIREEVEDYQPIYKNTKSMPAPIDMIPLEEVIISSDVHSIPDDSEEVTQYLNAIKQCLNEEDLRQIFEEAKNLFKGNKRDMETIAWAKDIRKSEITEPEKQIS